MRIRLLRALIATVIILIVFRNVSYAQGTLTNTSVNINDNEAGVSTIYTFNFTTGASGIPIDGKIIIIFPSGFEVTDAIIAQTTNSTKMNGGFSCSGSGGVITIIRDGTGTAVSGNTAVGVVVAVVENNQTAVDTTVTIETKQNDDTPLDSGTSPTFSIIHGFLDSFEFDPIDNHTAGDDFNITITAKDQYGNTVEDFTSTATLSDTSGTIFPVSTPNFSTGNWSGDVHIKRSGANNEIMASAQNKFGVSNKFNVNPGLLNHFVFDNITSPRTAGTPFTIGITAQDQNGNTVTSFTGKVILTDHSGSLNTESNSFNSGILSQAVNITKSQKDNYITAAYSTISDQSNLFNVEPGNLEKFYINTISSQTAGEWFPITVIAQDNYDNTVIGFESKVTMSDVSGNIYPTESGNFVGGQWTGDVKVSSPQDANVITVTKFAGTETGASNIFDVEEGSLDHFKIEDISNPQIAGSQFSITITAKDKEENTVSSFSGQVNISDLSNSISPGTSSNFVNGEWTDFVTITKSKLNNQIHVSGSNKEGTSNPFNVTPGTLDHFTISDVSSPQIAGQDFLIAIEACDANENIVTGFTTHVNLADETGTISLTSTPNFISGQWSGDMNITQQSENNKITATDPSSGKKGFTNSFNVQTGVVNHIVIRDNAGGLGSEVGDLTFNIGDQKTLYAAGYDQWNNFVRNVVADWDTTGNIDRPSPQQGTFTVFNPTTPYTSGRIYADGVNVVAIDSTGIFTVGSIHHILIRNEADGNGKVVTDVQMTSDDSLVLYAAAYDEGNGYLGSAAVDWSSSGGLQPAVSETDTFKFVFKPTTARVSGYIIAAHATAPNVSTGLITVNPGAPVGTIILHPDPKLIAAYPDSFSIISSDAIFDFDGNAISEGELFTVTVSTTLGIVTTPDEEPDIQGNQIKSNAESKIIFQINAKTEGGTAFIHANSIGKGSAVGDTTLIISNLRIVSVNTDFERASQGQLDLPVRMVVENVGSANITIISAGTDLKFTGPAPNYANVTGEYGIDRTDGITQILGNTQATLTFLVDVADNATKDIITIDGYITGEVSGLTVSDYSASQVDEILIQSLPILSIKKIEAFADTVIQGTSTTVKATIRNDGEASVVIDSDNLTFWAENIGIDVTNEYGLEPYLSNSDTLVGYSSEIFTYTIKVGTSASIDTISLDGKVSGHDINSDEIVTVIGSDSLDGWWVKQASDVEITEFTTSQSTVTNGQEGDWYLYMVVNNSGGADLKLDSIDVEFSLGGMDISYEYMLIHPVKFQISGSDTLHAGESDTLKITVDKTGTTLGIVTITGTVYLNDMISGQVEKNSVTGVAVQSPAQLTIDYISTSQSEVTIGQAHPWQIIVSLTNNGGGDIALDSTNVTNFISFNGGDTSFDVTPAPGFYESNNFVLKSGKTDSLFFTVDTTGDNSGDRKIYVNVLGYEINSKQSIGAEDSAEIKVELPADIRIKETKNSAPNSPYVDTEQNFQIKVIIENRGEDGAKNIDVSLFSDSTSTILNSTKNISLLQGGKSDTLIFDVQAFSNTIVDEIFSAVIDTAIAENTPEPDKILITTPMDSVATAIVQHPAQMEIISVISSDDTVKALTTEKWEIRVAVRNNGEGDLIIEEPSNTDISFSISGELQGGYSITAPTGFQYSPDLKLTVGEQDSLIYEVTQTGLKGGLASVKLSISGNYPNSNSDFAVLDSTEVFINPSSDVSIFSTEPVCRNIDQYGIGQLNSGQDFKVQVDVKNSGAERVDNVIVNLTAPGYSIDPYTIENIPPSGDSLAIFNVTANSITDQLILKASIVSATTHESGLPANISTSSDSTAYVRVHEPARLKINIDKSDPVYTVGQTGQFRMSVSNLGTAGVDSTGLLSVQMPAGYFLIKGGNFVQSDTANFAIDQQLNWQVSPAEDTSSNDIIEVLIYDPPKDKNTNQFAKLFNDIPFDTFAVSTVPSKIVIQSFEIISPQGATDDTISTRQNFNIELKIETSENLDSIRASINLPSNFGFGIQEDSLKYIPTKYEKWELRAPEAASTELAWINVTVYGTADGVLVSMRDSFAVVVQRQAEIFMDRIWTSSQADSIFSTGQEFDLNVMVKSGDPNQAKVEGDAYLEINFGATNITMKDPLYPLRKKFKVDSVVNWRVKAPDFEKGKSPLTIIMEQIPDDENTNKQAVVRFGVTQKNFYVETVPSMDITVDALEITTPAGATDNVLSSHQLFNIETFVYWETCADTPYVTLRLPGGFSTQESNPKKPSPGLPGSVGWSIIAPGSAVQDQHIWLQISAKDANSGNPFTVISDSIKVNVVERPEILLNTKIISPASALDGEISAGEEFVVSTDLTKSGDANLVGNFSAELTLPEGQGYSTTESLTRFANFNQSISWTIKAPYSERKSTNLIIALISAPQDENTNATIPADAILNTDVEIPISTEEKNVTISIIADNGKNTIARGDTSITVFGLEFMVSGDAYSNNVLFSGVKVKLKDHFGNLIDNPGNAISKLAVVNYQNSSMVYGQVTEIPTNNPIEVLFAQTDTIKPEIANRVGFKVDVAANASITDFQISIDSSQAFQLIVESSGRVPNIKNETGETLNVLNLFSSPSVIIEADFKKSFFNYPNPFGDADRSKTYFVYYLEQDSDVRIQIYTLIGEKVWSSRSYSKNDPQGRKGPHEAEIIWDARNDRGHKVLNGVYVARISTGNNKNAIAKIAVIK